MNSTFCALKKVHRPKQTFFGQTSIEKQPAIGSEHFTVGLFAMIFIILTSSICDYTLMIFMYHQVSTTV